MYSFSRKMPFLPVMFFVLLFTVAYGEVDWTAYNDCVGSTMANPNTTEFTDYLDYTGSTSGLLKNDATGSTAGMPTVTFTIPTDTAIQPVSATGTGVNPTSGTEAYVIFNGKVDFSGTIIQHPSSCGTTCWFVEIKFTNLNPLKKYTFVGSAFKGTDYADRTTQCTIQGADAFTNNSSVGVVYKIGAVTKFRAGNNIEGYVVRWDDIEPGSDGEFSIYTVSADAGGRLGYPLHGFMLQQIDVSVNLPPVVNAGVDQTMTLPKEYLTLTGSVSDDGWGNPMGYLESTWSQLSGPATVELMTDIHQPQVTARFPAAGDYELQLYATDGLLNASDVVMITAADTICPVGDIDGDCIVGFSDLGLLALNWLDNTGTSVADLDGDAWVKMQDLTLLAQSWLDNWTGSLRVTISPPEVVTAGAKWRVDGGTWQSSGATVSSLPEGSHDVEYSVVANWSAPGTEMIQITRQQTTVTSAQYLESPQIVISEFMAVNSCIPFVNPMDIYTYYSWNIINPDGKVYPDWIELHNNSLEAINLAGWYLTDDPDNKTKWQFPAGYSIPVGGYFVVFASNKEQSVFPANYPFVDYYGALHTNFELSASGEYLAVVAPDGVTISYQYNDYPEQFPFMSYGIAQDDTLGYLTPTPGTRVNNKWTGAANSATGLPGKVADTKFSHNRGFYESAFNVTITCETAGAEIHYTLDGTEPQATVGGYTFLYSGAINISSTKCLRAKAFKAGLLPSNTDTQTYLFLNNVVTQVKPADSRYVTTWGSRPADYEMENNTTDIKLVAGNAGYTVAQAQAVIKNALKQIPTLSVVTNPDGLFGSTIGIYTHTYDSGDIWERPVSAEYFGSDPNDIFQIDCGLNIQGGASRNPDNAPKHSLSLRFRGGYGDAKLKTNLFKQTSVDEFDSLHLRAVYNNSWIHWDPLQRNRGELIRDQFIHDSFIAMGQESGGDGTFVHLYLNGLYWGIYILQERIEASHYAAYHGGDSDYYDAINGGLAVDGVSTSWNAMQTIVQNANPSSQTDWEAINAVVDVKNYIDWTIIQHYGWNKDLKDDGNWRAAGGGIFSMPWEWYVWDVERTMEEGAAGIPHDAFNPSQTDLTSPPFLRSDLQQFEEFRIQFADRVYKYFRNQGALTYASASARFNSRVTELNDAIIAESARWGDYRRDVHQRGTAYLFTKSAYWTPAVSAIDGYLLAKETNAINYFKGLSPALYPAIEPPVFTVNSVVQSGGPVSIPYTFDMDNNNGVGDVYYTLDGTDPRAYWTGNVSPTAVLFNGTPIGLNKSVTVKARVKNGTTWSALHEATYVDERVGQSLRITELMYHPADPNTGFIELRNIGAETINLNLVEFTNGVDFVFGDTALNAGQFALVVQNQSAFVAKYGTGLIVAGQYTGSLDNAGEKIELVDAIGTVIHEFSYSDGWYEITDGAGFSLTIKDPNATDPNLWDQKAGWRPSAFSGGSPGTDDSGIIPALGSVVINEVLAHSHDIAPDWIELHNTTSQGISLGGWFLSDSNADDPNRMKYRIADTVSIPANGYVVFYQTLHFGNLLDPGCLKSFALSEGGDSVYLFSGNGSAITGYFEEELFDASETDVAFGRYYKASTDSYNFVAMSENTPGAANAYPKVGPIVIGEIMYNPPAGGTYDKEEYEYIELRNIETTPVTLQEYDPLLSINVPWKIVDGVDYTFPLGVTIPENGGTIVVVKNVAAFSARYPSVPTGKIYGPYTGNLSNAGEKVDLAKPGDEEVGIRYYIRVDRVAYSDGSHPVGSDPWPVAADGLGSSLTRINNSLYGNDVANWQAATPDPGQ